MILGVDRGPLEREDILEESIMSLSEIGHMTSLMDTWVMLWGRGKPQQMWKGWYVHGHSDTHTHTHTHTLFPSETSSAPECKVGLLLCNNVRNVSDGRSLKRKEAVSPRAKRNFRGPLQEGIG